MSITSPNLFAERLICCTVAFPLNIFNIKTVIESSMEQQLRFNLKNVPHTINTIYK